MVQGPGEGPSREQVEFATLRGLDGYRAAFPSVFAGMEGGDDRVARRVVQAAHSSVLEGWEPTDEEMGALAADVRRPEPSRMGAREIEAMVAELAPSDGESRDTRTQKTQQTQRTQQLPQSPAANPAAAWRRYFYPGTGVLRNRLGIRAAQPLSVAEHRMTSRLGADLADLAVEGELHGETTSEKLAWIHAELFGGIYDFAGTFRDVNMTKGGQSFGDHASMGMYLRQVDGLIRRVDWDGAGFAQTVDGLAEVHTDLNFAHPAREGNGRTGRLFMTDLAARHGVVLDFSAVDRESWIAASAATFGDAQGLRMDTGPMEEVYRRIARPRSPRS
ncbi:Fic/DOC family protein [Corynebacterium sp. AOP12-C2-36]|uniref:Fic/DOC family protein n=1 Tax=Corynebacterium sp. AOP12-C2-36 TaxID=3457723 RepID=UPI0040334823